MSIKFLIFMKNEKKFVKYAKRKMFASPKNIFCGWQDGKNAVVYIMKQDIFREKNMTDEKVQRINELARKSKTEGLTDAEKAEQKALRDEYIADYRKQFIGIMDNTYIKTPDGKKTKVTRREDK